MQNDTTIDPNPSLSGELWCTPVSSQLKENGTWEDLYRVQGIDFTVASASSPFGEDGRVALGHDVFRGQAWIGGDSPVPHRRISVNAAGTLGPYRVQEFWERYASGDYGVEDGGELGFAVYPTDDGVVFLIDEAVRTPEGEPPARDPQTSPGPQSLMMARDY